MSDRQVDVRVGLHHLVIQVWHVLKTVRKGVLGSLRGRVFGALSCRVTLMLAAASTVLSLLVYLSVQAPFMTLLSCLASKGKCRAGGRESSSEDELLTIP
eukprot:596826-Amphidinium_carterae.1